MRGNNQCSFFNKGLDAPNDSLSIEVTIEPLIEASLEIEEEEHLSARHILSSFHLIRQSQLANLVLSYTMLHRINACFWDLTRQNHVIREVPDATACWCTYIIPIKAYIKCQGTLSEFIVCLYWNARILLCLNVLTQILHLFSFYLPSTLPLLCFY